MSAQASICALKARARPGFARTDLQILLEGFSASSACSQNSCAQICDCLSHQRVENGFLIEGKGGCTIQRFLTACVNLQGGSLNSSLGQSKQLTAPSTQAAKNGLSRPDQEPAPVSTPMAAALVDSSHSNGAPASSGAAALPSHASGPPAASGVSAAAASHAGKEDVDMPHSAEPADVKEHKGPGPAETLQSKPSGAPVVNLAASGLAQEGNSLTEPAALQQLPHQVQGTAEKTKQGSSEDAAQQPVQAEAPKASVQVALTKEAAVERLEGMLRRLSAEHDPEGFFRNRVSTDLKGCENYYERIKHPMWLSLISSKVDTHQACPIFHIRLIAQFSKSPSVVPHSLSLLKYVALSWGCA